jgi:hypothetical protein
MAFLARLGARGTRIGEFTPLGFVIGFFFCFSFFWIVYHRLPFGTVPPTPAVQPISVRDFDQQSAQVKSDEQSISELDRKVRALELELKQRQNTKTKGPK